jgi:GT2 family glycosyltransferase
MQPSAAQVPSVVPSFIGFAHMIRRDRFLALGGFREAFGFYGEEKEFCLRLLEAGLHTVYLPHALVAHVVDPHSRDRRRYLRFVARNDCLNSLLNDPFTRLAWMLPARYALYFRMRRGWKIRDPWGGLWLLRELASELPDAWRARRPVSRGTLSEWRALGVEPRAYRGPLQSDGVSGR